MSYNKNNQYNTRYSGRYNTPGQFVPASEGYTQGQTPQRKQQQPVQQSNLQPVQQAPQQQQQQQQQQQRPQQQPQQQQQAPVQPPLPKTEQMDTPDQEMQDNTTPPKPHWMKTKLTGLKKISNKERRRRQNQSLRRLLTPKNALMALNEMVAADQQHMVLEPAASPNQFFNNAQVSFCADLTIGGANYKGYGENKVVARNAAAEQAIRDLIIKKLNQISGEDNITEDTEATSEELPMIQLASFALHKLFAEWGYEGHKLPPLKNTSSPSLQSLSESEPAPPKGPRAVPLNASAMHPCMLLMYLRAGLTYRELDVTGTKPQDMMFTVGVDVDGTTYIGKASSKREARKAAAKAACSALFNVEFEPNATATAPVLAK